MNRRLTLSLLVVLVAALFYLLRDPQASSSPTTTPSGSPDRSANPEPATATGAAARTDATTRSDERRQLETQPAGDASGGTLLLRAVDAESGRPVAGAEVFVLSLDQHSGSDLEVALAADASFERLFLERGHRWLTGADGAIRIPRPKAEAGAIARHQGRFGLIRISAPAPKEVEIRLSFSPTLAVRVVDAGSQPAAGVPLQILPTHARIPLRRAFSDEAGRAEFPHLSAVLPLLSDRSLRVSPRLVMSPAPQLAVALDDIPAEALTLTLPACGEVQVRLRAPASASTPDWGTVRLGLAAERPPSVDGALALPAVDPTAETQSDADGKVRFPYVGLGLQLEARVPLPTGGELTSAPFAGPTTAGEVVRFEFLVDPNVAWISGNVFGPDGSTLAATAIEFAAESPTLSGLAAPTERLLTGDLGEFRLGLPLDRPGGPPDRLVFRLRRPGEIQASAEAEVPLAQGLLPGEFALGQIQLQEIPLLVSGRLVDASDRGLAQRALMVEEQIQVGSEQQRQSVWQTNFAFLATTDAAGNFAIRGAAPATPLRLAFSDPGFQPLTQPFRPGDQGLVLRAEAAAQMFGSVKLDPKVPPGMLFAFATRLDVADAEARQARIDDKGNMVWSGLAPGTYGVALRTSSNRDPVLFEIDGVQVEAGAENRDPRLQGIDLRQRLRSFAIRLEDEQGEAVPMAVLRHPDGDRKGPFFSAMRGQATILTTRWPLDLLVEAQGFRPLLIDDLAEDRTVVLRRGLAVMLRLESVPDLGSDETLGVSVSSAASQGFELLTQAVFDESGVAKLNLASPGVYRVDFKLIRRRDRLSTAQFSIGGQDSSIQIEVTESSVPQHFSLALPLDDLERARQAGSDE